MLTREEMHSLVQEISGAHQARAAGIASLRREVTSWLRDETRERQAGARQLRAELAQTDAQRRAGIAAWLHAVARGSNTQAQQLQADLAQTDAQRRAGVTGWLRAVARGLNTQAQQLHTDLAQTDAQRRAQAQQLHTNLAQTAAQRRAGVTGWLRAVARGHAEAREEWQKLAPVMRPRSNGHSALDEETLAEEDVEELAALTGVAFQYLADRPDGAPLVEIEQAFQLGRFRAAGVVKRLMDDGKAEKRGRLYFAI